MVIRFRSVCGPRGKAEAHVHFVVMGCGRVGASLATMLDSKGHSVAVVDQDSSAFLRLGPEFGGITVTGVGFDRETLEAARTSEAYAFAAVSSGDNSNILAVRVARETFGVEHVTARIYDPRRAQVFERLGIPTVATVRWTADQLMRRLIPHGLVAEYRDPSGHVVIAEIHYHPDWVGRRLDELEAMAPARAVYVTRLSEGLVARPDSIIQEGDLLHFAVDKADIGRVEELFDAPIEVNEE